MIHSEYMRNHMINRPPDPTIEQLAVHCGIQRSDAFLLVKRLSECSFLSFDQSAEWLKTRMSWGYDYDSLVTAVEEFTLQRMPRAKGHEANKQTLILEINVHKHTVNPIFPYVKPQKVKETYDETSVIKLGTVKDYKGTVYIGFVYTVEFDVTGWEAVDIKEFIRQRYPDAKVLEITAK
jgi:hypothetical protein